MAEGGDFGYDDPALDYDIDHDDDDDDEDDEEVNRTRPFQPGAASTPYHGGEQHGMQTMHEQSGLPDTSYEETPFFRRAGSISDLHQESLLRRKMKKAVDFIKDKFPTAKFENIKIRRGTGKNTGEVVAIGSKGAEYKVLKDDESGLMKSFLNSFKNKLGPSAEEIIAQDRDTIREQQQRLVEAERQQREADIIAAERDEESREIQNLRSRTERVQAQIDAIQEEQGSNLESETELNRLKQLKKNYEKDLEIKKKKLGALQKEAKNKDKAQAKVDRERAKLTQIEKDRNEIEKRLNSTKAIDELKEQESELKGQNEEDQAIIQDDNTSPSEREAAEAMVAERNEELAFANSD